MAGFSDEEVAAAVDRFLLKQVTVPTLKTGARDILTARDRVYDLLTTALLLRPDAYFYVIYLARNRLMALVSQQLVALDSIISAAPNTTRPSKLIRSTTDLAAAQAALLDLSAGLNSRSTGVRGSIGPAVDRFRRSISSFVSGELTKNVVVGGQVTKTGPELRSAIASTWVEVVDRHAEIVRLASNLAGALSALENVRLPETSVRDIVSRIQARLSEVKAAMESDAAIEQSRPAMLDLLTMRTLLTKASTFRNPELVLMPKTRDSSVVTFLDSPGTQARIQGTISGPFNYGPGTSLSLSVGGGGLVAVTLPRSAKGSRAELRSRVFSSWVAPSIGDEMTFSVDFSLVASFTVPSAYASGSAAAAAFNAALSPVVSCAWDSSTNQLVFQSGEEGDGSHLRLVIGTTAQQDFRNWAFPPDQVPFIESAGEPVPAAEIAEAISRASPLVSADVVENSLASFVGERSSVSGEQAVIWNRIDSGSDLVSAGTALVTSPSKNFESMGVRPGMALHTTAPGSADYAIVSVSANELVLSAAPPIGVLTYYIGPDYRSVPAGARVQVVSGANRDNSGLYRVVSGDVARITVDRDLQTADARLSVSIFEQFIGIEAVGTTTSAGVGVTSASAGATALGLAVTVDEARPLLTRLRLSGPGDFLLRGVRAGDLVSLVAPSGALYADVVIASVTTTDLLIEQAGIPYEPGNWGYEIRSYRASQFHAMQQNVNAFLITPFVLGFARLDGLVGRLIRGARYSSEIETAVTDYRSDMSALRQALEAYSVPRERTIDNVVRTLREQGLDRALDLFLTLEIAELFSMEADGVSYSTWLVRKAATVAREVVPVSKYARSDRIVQEWRTVSFQPDPFDPRGEDTQR